MKTRDGLNGHGRYYIYDETNQKAYPSVTTVISEMSDKSGLVAWKKRVGEKEAERTSTFSANRGTFMHALQENYLDALFDTKTEQPLVEAFKLSKDQNPKLTKEEMACGKDLFFNFVNKTNFYERIQNIKYSEVAVWSNKGGGYAGRMDLVIEDVDDKCVIIDFKTSKKPKRESWIDGYKMQMAAYSVALYERTGSFPDEGQIWISCETGEVQNFLMTSRDIRHWFREFIKLVNKYHEKYPVN